MSPQDVTTGGDTEDLPDSQGATAQIVTVGLGDSGSALEAALGERLDSPSIRAVETAMEALDVLTTAEDPVDCVVSRHDLPDSDGLTLLGRMEADGPTPPFVLFAAAGGESLAEQALSAGVTDYVSGQDAAAETVLASRVAGTVRHRQREREFERERRDRRGIIETSHGGIATLDAEGRFRSVSDRAAEILGRTEAELRGQPFEGPEWDLSAGLGVSDPVLTVTQTGESIRDYEFAFERPDGERRVLSMNATPERTGGEISGVIVSLSDITERRRQQEELDRRQTQLRALFDEAADPMYVHDADGEILDVSQQAVDTLGYDRETLLEMTIMDLETTKDPASLRDLWAEFPDGETVSVTSRHRRADGSEFPVEVHVNKLTVDGETRFIAQARDISEQEAIRGELEASERALSDLYEVLADTDREFEAKLSDLLDIGCRRLELPLGYLAFIDEHQQNIVAATGDHELIQPGESAPLERAYCRKTIDSEGLLAVSDALEDGWEDDPAYETYDLGCYLGGKVLVEGELYGTLCFAGHTAREQAFSEAERAFVELLTQWVSYELERRERRQELEREHDLFARTEAMATIGAWELVVDTRELYWTDQVRAIHDVDSEYDPTLDAALEFYHPDDRPLIRAALDRAIQTGESYDKTVRLHTAEGQQRWVRTMGEPHEVDGEITHIRGTIQDISERKAMEEEIRDQNRTLRTILDNVPTILFEIDAEGEFVRVRGEGMDALAIGPAYFEGRSAMNIFEDEPVIRANIGRALAGEQIHDVFEYAGVTFEVWYEPVVVDGSVERVIGTAIDVTEREAYEQTLSELHDVTRELLGATTMSDVASVAFDGATEILDLETVAILLYDDEEGGLVPVEYSERIEASMPAVPAVWPEDSNAWTAFEQGVIVSRSELSDDDHSLSVDDRPGAGAFIPLGEYGVLVVGGEDTDQLDTETLDLAETLAATAETVLARVDREQALQTREQQLREEKAFTDGLLDSLPDIMFALDAEGEFVRWNDRLLSVTGHSPDRLREMDVTELVAEPDRHRAAEQLVDVSDGSMVREELTLQTATDDRVPYEFTAAPVVRDDTVVGVVGIGRDISAQVAHEETLTALHKVTRDLLRAESQSTIGEHVVTAAERSLAFDGVGVFLFDETENALRPVAYSDRTAELVGEVPSFGPGDGIAWDVFVEGEGRVYDDVRQVPEAYNPETPFRTELFVPLGDHGVLVAGKTTAEDVSDRTLELAQILAANCEAALTRMEREQSLRERDRELQEQNARLEQLKEINEKIRRIDHALVGADTRSEIEAIVAQRLAAIDRFSFAWIGSLDPVDDGVVPEAWDGTERGYLDSVTFDSEPAARAARTGETVIVDAVAEDLRSEPWRKEALSRDFLSVAAVPLVYDGVTKGVVTVYADEPRAFTEMAEGVLAELGETVAHAINAVEQKQALVADSQIELEFSIPTDRTALTDLVAGLDCDVSVDSMLHQADGSSLVYVGVAGAESEAVREAAAELVTVDRVRPITSTAEGERLELRLTGESMVATVAEHGGRLERMRIDDGDGRVVVTLPETADVRSFIDLFLDKYPGAELYARRRTFEDTVEAGVDSPLDQLTPKQAEAMQVALYSGFFEWPRESTGEEIAETLDVSPPTFLEHLRRAESKLLETVVDIDQ